MRELPTSHFVKICGVTSVDDARMIVDAGADAIGLILAPSPRRVAIERASEICDAIGGDALRTLVFRNTTAAEVLRTLDMVDADAVQVHGTLEPTLVTALFERVRVIKALSVTDDDFLSFDETSVSAVLVDGPNPGSGQTHSFERLRTRGFSRPLIVAGGLAPHNVAAIIAATTPWGVDCASGVEVSPGIKDPTLVTKFVQEAHRGFSS